MKKLYFVRHGLSKLNVKGHFAGHTDTPLTKEGRLQAKRAGEIAKKLQIDCIACSPLSRALDTAKVIAKEIGHETNNIHISNLLIERYYGQLEDQPWHPDLNLDGIADLEKDDELLERAKLAIKWIEDLPGEHKLVVSHGSFGRALRKHFMPDYDFQEKIPNAQIVCWLEK